MSSTSVPQKRTWNEVNDGSHSTWPSIFTLEQEAYVFNNLKDSDGLAALGGSGPKAKGAGPSLDCYESLAKKFNNKFKTTLKGTQIRNEICMLRFLRAQGKRHRSISDSDDDVDDSEDDDYYEYGGGNDHGDDGDVQATSSTRESNILEAPAEETLGRSTEKAKSKAMAYRTQSDDLDSLDMLKDLKHTSMLQCEAEMERTRREQLRIEERSRGQQDIVQLEQLRVEEARLRMEESRVREEESTKRAQLRFEEAKMREEESTKLEQLREEETTKRESIWMELEKIKEQTMILALAPPLSRESSSSSLSSLESVFSTVSTELIPSDKALTSPLNTRAEMASIAALSPPASPTRPERKRGSSVQSESPSAKKRIRICIFSLLQETYMAEQIMDPIVFAALYGEPGATFNGQPLPQKFYDGFTRAFNERFRTSVSSAQIRGKLANMKWQWIGTYRVKISAIKEGLIPPSSLEARLKERCHYYYTLEPALIQTQNDGESAVVSGAGDGDDEESETTAEADEEEGDDNEEQTTDSQATSSTNEPRTSVKTFVTQLPKVQSMATASQTQPDEMDLLDMLKDIKDTSKLQCEAEKEQTRREQLRFQERARAQQETNRLEQLRIEEATKRDQLRVEEIRLREEELTKRERLYIEDARMRVEETKMREEEATKREEIRANVEKVKEQVRMKELEVEHTSKLLLLEQLRLKRAIVEKEGLAALRFKKNIEAVE
ncbi:hypothetical protein BGX34_007242 [Mortierella sp. NVP85]|nr:hypothetical protein BGX34_007242 [Mortierella sp. NVP85]